jgi:predicted nucleic acid-binding protein
VQVLVDTSVWSLALRRRTEALNPVEKQIVAELAALIDEGRAELIGPIRQEILSGVREPAQYSRLLEHLSSFRDAPVETTDFEAAATLSNRCRGAGVAGSPVDFLICAVALQRKWAIFTADQDFRLYSRILGVKLHPVRK